MMNKETDKKRTQMPMVTPDELVPQDHLLRLIDKAIDFDFIYDLVYDKYSHTTGSRSLDPEACDKNGWILGYTIHPGNKHDS